MLRDEDLLEDCVKDFDASKCAVAKEAGCRDEQSDEVAVVVQADTVVDPDTVVVLALYAGFADGAVFAAGWFGTLGAGSTTLMGVIKRVVVRIAFKSCWVRFFCDVVAGCGVAEIEPEIGIDDKEGNQ